MDIGPFELIVLVFPGARADPAVVEVLSGVVSRGYVTVLDLVFLTRTSEGHFRITNADENLHEIGLGSLEIRAQPLISEKELDVVRDSLEPGTSAAVIAYEHSWAQRLAGAVAHAGGTAVALHVPGPRDVTQRAGQQRRFAGYQSQRQAVAESEAAVREAEAEAAAAQRAADQYATFQPRPTADDDLVSRLDELT
jgi:hypothetical protein